MNTGRIYSAGLDVDVVLAMICELRQQLAELRAASRAYFEQSDLVELNREAIEASDRLATLINRKNAT